MAASVGLDTAFTSADLRADDRQAFTKPVVVEDVEVASPLDHRRKEFAAAGIRSVILVPLQIRGRPNGTVSFYFRRPYRPTDLELRIAHAFGQLTASAISSAELFAEQQALREGAVEAAERAKFLAQVSARLTSLDYEQNLAAIANLVVPRFADWCVIDLLEGGELRRLAIAHTDAAKVGLARELDQRYPPRRDTPGGPWQVMRSGEPTLIAAIDDAMLRARGARPRAP